MSFVDEFLDFMPARVTATPGYTNEYGTFIASGAVIADIPARIEGRRKLVRREGDAQQILSSVQLYLGAYNGLRVDTHRFSIPSTYTPNTDLTALSVEVVTDETGPIAEVVYLP